MATNNLLQSADEWAARNRVMAGALGSLIVRHALPCTQRGIDIGCQTGFLVDALNRMTPFAFSGVDPRFEEPTSSEGGSELLHGWAHDLPFPNAHFDCAVLANVYEHIDPKLRTASLREISRVLVPGGLIVGQMPNPFFPIESHSRLPFMGWLPTPLKKVYWRLAPVDWPLDFYTVTVKDLQRRASRVNLEPLNVRNFNYPPEAIPRRMRSIARTMERPMRVIPWAWQFVLRKPSTIEP